MKKTKEVFKEVRETIGNHAYRAIARYYEAQGADKDQIKSAMGKEVIKWK